MHQLNMTICTVAEKPFPNTTRLEWERAVPFYSLPVYPPLNLDDSCLQPCSPNSFLRLQRLQQRLLNYVSATDF